MTVGAQYLRTLIWPSVAEDLLETGEPHNTVHSDAGDGDRGGDQAADEPAVHKASRVGLVGLEKLSGWASGNVPGRSADGSWDGPATSIPRCRP
jgi:hypothetical protein